MRTTMLKEFDLGQKTKVELADAHSHLDLIGDAGLIEDAVEYGVATIVTDGVDTKSNLKSLEMADGKHLFPALGIGPEYANSLQKGELEFNLKLIRENAKRVVAIGEIGLDYMIAEDAKNRTAQKRIFEAFLDLAEELKLPVCVHSRKAMDEVLSILEDRKSLAVQLHFFEGDVKDAKVAMDRGYMISIPPIESAKRKRVINDVPVDRFLAETDSPVVGSTPKDVERVVRMIGGIKGIDYGRIAQTITANTKKFFNINKEKGFMRY